MTTGDTPDNYFDKTCTHVMTLISAKYIQFGEFNQICDFIQKWKDMLEYTFTALN